MNLSLLFVFLVTLPILISLLYPRSSEAIEPAPLLEEETKEEILRAPETPAERWEQSDLLLGLVAVIGFVSLFVIGWGRFRLNLNSLNFVFLLLGMALHRTPRNYLRAITAGVKGTSGIILLFPFYAGIFGLLTYDPAIYALADRNDSRDTVRSPYFLKCGTFKSICPLRRRAVGDPRGYGFGRGQTTWDPLFQNGDGGCIWGRVDQHVATLLGASHPPDHRPQGPSGDRLHNGHPDRSISALPSRPPYFLKVSYSLAFSS